MKNNIVSQRKSVLKVLFVYILFTHFDLDSNAFNIMFLTENHYASKP